ncbi:MAG: 16S rRNA (guanine(966)-N(2))-methyltransferase RsmD [Oscillospiraceae bacterium]|nr:16S rRNA (guanine(966)-N(2))-methyltransferase RsmD [Oscillospiraceae bacterium]
MRVITGIAGGRKLKSPSGDGVRPTADQVKQAMFNILQFDLEGRRVLDLFAGTGQLGIEALSRGAREAVFTDSSRSSVELIRQNLSLCRLEGAGRVLKTDALSYLSRGERFDVILIDPPYDAGLYTAVLEKINSVDNLNEGGIIVCEARAGTALPEMKPPYRKLREKTYGSVKICLFTKDAV